MPSSIASPEVSGSAAPPDGAAGGRFRERVLRRYYALKYHLFRRERRPRDGRRGLIVLQIDALAYADLRRAITGGYCPTLERMLAHEDYELRRWFCGLPSATPYCQAGIFHGENEGIPAFRFYDRRLRRVITCNTLAGVQYVRDRLHAPGALAGGSSYVNLLDGDAQTVAFTVATRDRTSVYQRLGGTRMLLLILLHPVRLLRMVGQAVAEWLREEWERTVGEVRRSTTHSEGLFPFIRVFTNVVVRELQTMAILLDVYLGVPVIYSTYMQYDELGHHFGPSSRPAFRDLARTDARIAEILRMIRTASGRDYDLVVLSDHGMTPAASYRVRFGESLGATVARTMEATAALRGQAPPPLHSSFATDSEYADVGPHVLDTVSHVASSARRFNRAVERLRDWLRRHYGLREILLPEKYSVADEHALVVTYSSCLALLYFAERDQRPDREWILGDAQRAALYRALREHPGIGLLITWADGAAHLESRDGRARLAGERLDVLEGQNPLATYGTEPVVLRAIDHLVRQDTCGDIVLFGAYDGYEIVSFDDQVGAHGSAGGDQAYPFLISPRALGLGDRVIEDARDLYATLMRRGAGSGAGRPADGSGPGGGD